MNSKVHEFCKIKNNGFLKTDLIPIYAYTEFIDKMVYLLNKDENHCVNYFAFKTNSDLQFIAAIADDANGNIILLSHILSRNSNLELLSLTPQISSLYVFEQEIAENFGINFVNHPWLKPLRYSYNRFNRDISVNQYPFYQIESHELHEVGVGPIHAGVIEPGHFRFICNGENVLHLEVQLGWQHRGVENLMLKKKLLMQRTIISESIAGDTAVGHSLAFAQLMESLAGLNIDERLSIERSIALELERIAIHIADISALCTDVAFNLGSNIFGILRTGIINFTQSWCGNRLGKGLIRVGGTNFPFSGELSVKLNETFCKFESQFRELARHTYKLPSVQSRFDHNGRLTKHQVRSIGGVGMVARMANVNRDIRNSHPFGGFKKYPIPSVTLEGGDVFARFLLRRKEINNSINWINDVLAKENFNSISSKPVSQIKMEPNYFAISLTEAWRGEICHIAITDPNGELLMYKIKDPSLHNWKALELSMRNMEISDFPINNKSYNLSYCGFDL